jgi:hypothetical protein
LRQDIANTLAQQNVLKMFTNVTQKHIHSKNLQLGNYFIQQSNLNKKKNYFSRFGPKIWNGIPNELCNRRTHFFKTEVNTILLRVLESEDVYVDVTKIVTKIKHIS